MIFFSADPKKRKCIAIYSLMADQITSELPKIEAEGSIRVHNLFLDKANRLNKMADISEIVQNLCKLNVKKSVQTFYM